MVNLWFEEFSDWGYDFDKLSLNFKLKFILMLKIIIIGMLKD